MRSGSTDSAEQKPDRIRPSRTRGLRLADGSLLARYDCGPPSLGHV
jgi:hypothetical protein